MNDTFRVFFVAILMVALTACATHNRTTSTASTSSDLPPEAIAADAEAEPNQGSTLADLAQRDVEAFLNRRRASSDEQDDAPEARPHEPRREIIWNQGPSSSGDSSPATTIALDNTPSIQPSSLFLGSEDTPDEPETPKPEPSDTLDRDRVRELVVELSKELYRDAAHADMPLRELFLIAATTLVSPDRELNADAIPGLTPRERDLLREFQQFFVQLGSKLDGTHDVDDIIIASIESLRANLRNDPQLQLGTVALCTRVGGFGDFDPFNKYAFLAHTNQQAVVYIELAGFTSELNQRSEWVTEISQQLTIYSDRDGIPVWREDWQAAVDVSKNKRHDFFVVQVITFPQSLSVGRYQLKLRLRDEKSGAEAEGTIPFEMVADPKLAASIR